MAETTKGRRPSFARHQAEGRWLAEAYETLDRQRRVLNCLSEARESLWKATDEELRSLGDLQTMVARVVIAQCEAITRHSGMGLEEDDTLSF